MPFRSPSCERDHTMKVVQPSQPDVDLRHEAFPLICSGASRHAVPKLEAAVRRAACACADRAVGAHVCAQSRVAAFGGTVGSGMRCWRSHLRVGGDVMRRSTLFGVAVALGVLALSGSFAVPAGAAPKDDHGGRSVCTGTLKTPGVLAGTYASNVMVTGVCGVNAGPTVVDGNLFVAPRAA